MAFAEFMNSIKSFARTLYDLNSSRIFISMFFFGFTECYYAVCDTISSISFYIFLYHYDQRKIINFMLNRLSKKALNSICDYLLYVQCSQLAAKMFKLFEQLFIFSHIRTSKRNYNSITILHLMLILLKITNTTELNLISFCF